MRAKRLLLFQVLIVPVMLTAQSWQVFDMDNAGLPSNTIRGLAQDQQGIIWAASNWGLCRYDGSDWTFFQQGASGLPENDLSALAVDQLDRLWIGTSLNGVAILD
ncbi:MAG: hypothetical protein M3R08_04375, partial [Bacteroidota bacterium]|nr:hypothetical protein [Bacteroidota bacterium]